MIGTIRIERTVCVESPGPRRSDVGSGGETTVDEICRPETTNRESSFPYSCTGYDPIIESDGVEVS